MTKFEIPPPRMPTLEEHRAVSAVWLGRIRPCLYENWPEPLKQLSFHTRLVEVSSDNIQALLEMFDNPNQSMRTLIEKIDAEIALYLPNGVFAKLSSRSAKDAWCETMRCETGAEILSQFADSMRILDDLIEYRYADTACYILLRDWWSIPKSQEWRCFVRDHKIVGLSQYHYGEHFSGLYGDLENVEERLKTFINGKVIPHLHHDPIVADIWLCDDPMLIEINPYGLSDPCLFTYDELEKGFCGMRINGSFGP